MGTVGTESEIFPENSSVFAAKFCSEAEKSHFSHFFPEFPEAKSGFEEFSSRILYECLAESKPEIISDYMEIFKMSSDASMGDVGAMRSIRLIRDFYSSAFGKNLESPLISPAFLELVHHRIEKHFASTMIDAPKHLKEYMLSGRFPDANPHAFAKYLRYHCIPSLDVISKTIPQNLPLPLLAMRFPELSFATLEKMSSAMSSMS